MILVTRDLKVKRIETLTPIANAKGVITDMKGTGYQTPRWSLKNIGQF